MDVAPLPRGKKFQINCSGSDGSKVLPAGLGGKPQDGKDGGRGGTLQCVVEDIGLDSVLEGVNLAARGGYGSNGEEVKVESDSEKSWEAGGNGGNGADGGRVQVLVGNDYTVILSKLSNIYQGLSASPPSARALYDLKTLSKTIRRSPQYTALDDLVPRLDRLDAAIQTGKPGEIKTPLQDLAVRFEREGDLLIAGIKPRVSTPMYPPLGFVDCAKMRFRSTSLAVQGESAA
jgi:hypothetical protein